MSKLSTGKAYELHGTPDRLRGVYPAVKAVAPDAVFVVAESDNVGVIGSNDPDAIAIGKLSLC